MDLLFKAIVTAFVAGVILTWLVRRAALALGVMDRPDGHRKLHASPIPLLGGIGVFAAWMIGMIASQALDWHRFGAGLLHQWGFRPTLFLAGGIVLISGILDDIYTLRPRWKLVGQTIAAGVLVAGGMIVKRIWLFGYTLELGWLGVGLTMVWLVGSMNAVNMLDGLDGLATTVGLVICGTLTWMACLTGNLPLGLVVISLAGALGGFLVFNFPPARIFLGDSGSMLIGLVIGAVAIEGSFKAPATAALAAPIAMLAIPIFDGMAAVIRRRLSGKAVYAPDRGHIHHCLLRRGWSNRQILVGVGAMCATTGFAVLLGLYFRSEPLALLATAAVVIGCVVTKLFGNYEYMLLIGTPRTKWKAIRGGLQVDSSRVLQVCTSLREASTIEEIRHGLRKAAEQLDWVGLQVRCTVPCKGDHRASKPEVQNGASTLILELISSPEFKGMRDDSLTALLPSPFPDHSLWQLALPLVRNGLCLGQLQVWGRSETRSLLPNLIGVSMVAEALTEVAKTFHEKDLIRANASPPTFVQGVSMVEDSTLHEDLPSRRKSA
jgi:UDP-GlcNAc:undecaprenyl-phosphate GlcNAc-1-phosphate transferase